MQQAAVRALLHLFSPAPIYAAMRLLARSVSRSFTPGLLVVALYVRIIETQIDSFSGMGRWLEAVRDVVLWGLVLSVYFAAGTSIAAYMNGIYAVTERWGSVAVISGDLGRALEQASASVAKLSPVARWSADFATFPVRLIAMLIYYVTLALLVFIAALTGIMHAIGYSLAFIYGLIAIPISVSGRLRLIRGWAVLYGFVLLWPIVQALIVALFRPVFHQAVHALASASGAALWSGAEVYLLFAVLNLLVAAVLLMAPAIAYGLVSNVAPASLSWSSTRLLGAALGAGWAMIEPPPVWYHEPGDADGDPDLNPDEWHLS